MRGTCVKRSGPELDCDVLTRRARELDTRETPNVCSALRGRGSNGPTTAEADEIPVPAVSCGYPTFTLIWRRDGVLFDG